MKMKHHDLNGIVEELQDLVPGLIPEGVRVKVELADCELRIMTDALKLKGALFNLIENAGDALSSGDTFTLSTRRIRVSNGMQGIGAGSALALVSISDTGTGMDEEMRDRMFEPFFTTKPGADRGLGCTIALRVIQCHNGRIAVESSVGNGTEVRVYLPLVESGARAMAIPLYSSFSAGRRRGIYR
jgi:signal transduction histidine kinase